jgi:hypothetical protein
MREKHIVRANLKGLRESRHKEESPDHLSHNKVDVAELLKQSNQGVDTSQNAEMLAYLYPNKRSIPQLFGNDFLQKVNTKISINLSDSPLKKETLFDSTPKNWPFFAEHVALISEINNYPIKCAEEWAKCFKNRPMPTDLPNLFHKYLLQMATPMAPYKYTVVQESSYFIESLNIIPITHVKQSVNLPHDLLNRVCIIHCFSLKRFNRMFHDYLHVLEKVFDVVVCFCIDSPNIRELSPNVSFLRIPNFGMDIASKFVAIDYLRSIGYEYEYIFYIHSKTDDIKRHEYIYPFIKNISKIVDIMNLGSVGGIFHDLVYCGSLRMDWYDMSKTTKYEPQLSWGRNECYLLDMIKYFDLPNNLFFPEGNFYILHKDVADTIYTDKNLYNILNTPTSFDYNWVNIFYNLNSKYGHAFKDYLEAGLYGNNMETQMGYDGMADCMIEHAFERIIFSVVLKLQKTVEIVSIYPRNHGVKTFCRLMNDPITSTMGTYNLYRRIYDQQNVCIIACHTYNDAKVNILLNNLSHFMEFATNIIIVNSSEFKNMDASICSRIQETYQYVCINETMTVDQLNEYRKWNHDLKHMTNEELDAHYKRYGKNEPRKMPHTNNIYVKYTKNDVFACFSKYMYGLELIELEKVSKIIFTNDSFLIVKPLIDFYELTQEDDIQMTSLVTSNEITYHHQDFLRCYDSECIHKLVDFYRENASKIKCFYDLNRFYEIPSTHIFERKNVLYEMPDNYTKNLHFDDSKLPYYLDMLDYPVIKYKKILHTHYSGRSIPRDFNPELYKALNIDLRHMSAKEATDHFILFGMEEGRLYKEKQRINRPGYLLKYLPEWIQ